MRSTRIYELTQNDIKLAILYYINESNLNSIEVFEIVTIDDGYIIRIDMTKEVGDHIKCAVRVDDKG